MYVDIGCTSKKEVEELGIRVGDPAVPYSVFRKMERTHIEKIDGKEVATKTTLGVAKAFDDRIGVFIVLEALKRITEEKINHPNTLYFVSTTQEEVGLRGARTSAQKIQPDIGFALDVDISGDLPGVDLIQKMGAGVSISAGDSSMIPNPKLRKFVIEQAEKNNIKWQPAFLPAGGTDAGIMHMTGMGAPSLFIGIPTRHIHSHNGIVDLNDVEQAITLIVAIIKALDETAVKSFCELM
jgi:endoglucanase